MNLLKREVDNSESNILGYRKYQYELIPDFFNICFQYMETMGFKFDRSQIKYDIIDDYAYYSQNHYSVKVVKIYLQKTDPTPFLHITIPTLLHDTFFKMNGCFYVPAFYVADFPITIKKNSYKVESLFKPLTIYSKDGRIIFLGSNIPVSRFLRLYYPDAEVRDIVSDTFNTGYIEEDFDTVRRNIASIIGTSDNLTDITTRIDDLFFDNWTRELYQTCYKLENPSIKNILDLIIKRKVKRNSFIDLDHKRIVFIEWLMKPLFEAVSKAVNGLVAGTQPKNINIEVGAITNHFFSKTGLGRNFFYDTTNGFSSLLAMKASFKNPGGKSELPAEVSNIHKSHKGRVCPVTISNAAPGQVVSLVPNQNINLKFGIFQ
jgi:hypothetical protein